MKHQAISSIKFKELQQVLRLPHWQAVGVLESLWLATQVNARNGAIGRYSNRQIAAMIEWQGDPDELISALIVCRWLDPHPDSKIRLAVHDWQEHAPRYVKGIMAKQKDSYVGNVGSERRKDTYVIDAGGQHARAEEPNLTIPNLTKPRGESCAEPLGSDSGAAAPPVDAEPDQPEQCQDHDPVVLRFPITGSATEREWALLQSKLDEFSESYPGIDVRAEMRKARQWCADNPSNRKTTRGMPAFLNRWLGKSVDTGRAEKLPTKIAAAGGHW